MKLKSKIILIFILQISVLLFTQNRKSEPQAEPSQE